MQTSYLRPTYLEIDQQAIYDNVHHERERLPQSSELFAVVKADAYGHGLVPVARVCRAAGASGFCVATLDEALVLREAQIVEPILVLGVTSVTTAAIAASQHISLTVADRDWLAAAAQTLADKNNLPPLALHLATDTGMGRIGFTEPAELQKAAAFVLDHPETFVFEGVFTHFATADQTDLTHFQQQQAKFKQMLAVLPEKPRYIHCANSATSLWHAELAMNMIRFGIALYGLNPSGTVIPAPYPLKPALALYSELVFVKEIHAGDTVGYGATYTAPATEWLGTIPIGYADGWLRRMSGMAVLIEGQRCPIVGRVCMDQIMVKMPAKFPVGSKVTLIGRDGADEITIQEVATYAQTIHYEIACGLDNRLPRHYLPFDPD